MLFSSCVEFLKALPYIWNLQSSWYTIVTSFPYSLIVDSFSLLTWIANCQPREHWEGATDWKAFTKSLQEDVRSVQEKWDSKQERVDPRGSVDPGSKYDIRIRILPVCQGTSQIAKEVDRFNGEIYEKFNSLPDSYLNAKCNFIPTFLGA